MVKAGATDQKTLNQLLDRCRFVANQIAVGALDYSALDAKEAEALWDLVCEGRRMQEGSIMSFTLDESLLN